MQHKFSSTDNKRPHLLYHSPLPHSTLSALGFGSVPFARRFHVRLHPDNIHSDRGIAIHESWIKQHKKTIGTETTSTFNKPCFNASKSCPNRSTCAIYANHTIHSACSENYRNGLDTTSTEANPEVQFLV